MGKIARRLRCEYVIRFEDDGKFYFLLETRSGYEEHFARHGLVRERELGGLHVQARFRQPYPGDSGEQASCRLDYKLSVIYS